MGTVQTPRVGCLPGHVDSSLQARLGEGGHALRDLSAKSLSGDGPTVQAEAAVSLPPKETDSAVIQTCRQLGRVPK